MGCLLTYTFGYILRRPGDASALVFWSGFALAQAVNVTVNARTAGGNLAPLLLYQALRFFAPGLVWAWLYRRHGFMAAVGGHMASHLLFEPSVGALLRA